MVPGNALPLEFPVTWRMNFSKPYVPIETGLSHPLAALTRGPLPFTPLLKPAPAAVIAGT